MIISTYLKVIRYCRYVPANFRQRYFYWPTKLILRVIHTDKAGGMDGVQFGPGSASLMTLSR